MEIPINKRVGLNFCMVNANFEERKKKIEKNKVLLMINHANIDSCATPKEKGYHDVSNDTMKGDFGR